HFDFTSKPAKASVIIFLASQPSFYRLEGWVWGNLRFPFYPLLYDPKGPPAIYALDIVSEDENFVLRGRRQNRGLGAL
ncbi:MAG: hypothetical protein ACP5JB_08130, partial [candidate division WOR-3 bacterium]